jgi:hypothetical protein
MPQFQHQKAMITFITNMLGVDLKDQHVIPTPTTFTTFKDDKGPCTYCKQDTHTWEQCRNRTQDHQLKKDVGSLHVLLNEQNRLLTKIVEKKVESKEAQEILAKNLQTLYRFTVAGRKIQGTQVQKANTPSTPQQKNVGGEQSFKENPTATTPPMQMKPYSGNTSWLNKKIPNLPAISRYMWFLLVLPDTNDNSFCLLGM